MYLFYYFFWWFNVWPTGIFLTCNFCVWIFWYNFRWKVLIFFCLSNKIYEQFFCGGTLTLAYKWQKQGLTSEKSGNYRLNNIHIAKLYIQYVGAKSKPQRQYSNFALVCWGKETEKGGKTGNSFRLQKINQLLMRAEDPVSFLTVSVKFNQP